MAHSPNAQMIRRGRDRLCATIGTPAKLYLYKTMNDLEIRRMALAKKLLEVEDETLIAEVERILRMPATYRLIEDQVEGLNEQLQEYLSGNATTSTWEEVKAKVAKKLQDPQLKFTEE